MNHFFSADYLVPVIGEPLPEAVVETSAEGEIVRIWKNREDVPKGVSVQIYQGIIVPGFINAHCHLELSHLHGKIPKQKGLVNFVKKVISERKSEEATIIDSMEKADKQMQNNGIVAVGDHANHSSSRAIKEKSPIYYHTFLEVMGFDPARAEEVMSDAKRIQKDFGRLPVSITPHAPYSTSRKLIRMIRKMSREEIPFISYHNQESEEENRFFKDYEGQFIELYEWLGQDISHFKSQSNNSVRTVGLALPRNRPVQLVHNTYTSIKDAAFLARIGMHVYWCLCPNANLYIEDRLPHIQLINQYDRPITLGTDSLASNDQLCILSEMRTYHQHFPNISLLEMLKWATWNGAEFLGISNRYGSIEVGKFPGLNLLENTRSLDFHTDMSVKKLI